MISFTNPGEINIHAVTTLGISAKEGSSPIGFFGTGLKYSIAVLLRENQEITIFSGENSYSFRTEEIEVRGKTFDKIYCYDTTNEESIPLGFTTDLGKNWGLEEVYRELYSNCIDEKGAIVASAVGAVSGRTTITVEGPEFEKVHENRDAFILDKSKKLLATGVNLEVYQGASSAIFYRGIRVVKLTQPSALTYNFTCSIHLTEDRTALYPWLLDSQIQDFFIYENKESLLVELAYTTESHEAVTSYDHKVLSSTFVEALTPIVRERPLVLPRSLLAKYYEAKKTLADTFTDFSMTPGERAMLNSATNTLSRAGFAIFTYPIRTVESCGAGIIGAALMKEEQILLSRSAFVSLSQLETTLLHEFMHLKSGCTDNEEGFINAFTQETLRLAHLVSANPPKVNDEIAF